MNDVSKKVVVLLAHPNLKESQANKALADAVKDIDGVMVYDLYEYQDQSFDVNVWSTIISDASMVVFQFPFHWMSAPSLLKRWLDEVFTSLADAIGGLWHGKCRCFQEYSNGCRGLQKDGGNGTG